MSTELKPGTIGWFDLTAEGAEGLREFYCEVAGWRAEAVAMGGYNDYSMYARGSDVPVAGVCHARGVNADLPACWLMYITVGDIARSVRTCEERGGRVIRGVKSVGPMGMMAVIADPAGAACALFEPARVVVEPVEKPRHTGKTRAAKKSAKPVVKKKAERVVKKAKAKGTVGARSKKAKRRA